MSRAPLKVSGLIQTGRVKVDAEVEPQKQFGAPSSSYSESPQAYEARIAELRTRLEEAERGARRIDIPLAQLQTVGTRRRMLTTEEYDQLRENLRHNELIEPIIVRTLEGGKYEVVTGHNRLAIFQELGRETIPALVRDTDAAKADIDAFYSNLLHPDLTDFEKYLGFKMVADHEQTQSVEALATRTGHSARAIRRLFAFDALPAAALETLHQVPGLIGGATAEAMAKLVAEGKGDQVIAAIGRIAAGELNETQALKAAAAEPKPQKQKAEPLRIKAGRSVYCAVHPAGKVLRLEFANEEERDAAQAAVIEALERIKK